MLLVIEDHFYVILGVFHLLKNVSNKSYKKNIKAFADNVNWPTIFLWIKIVWLTKIKVIFFDLTGNPPGKGVSNLIFFILKFFIRHPSIDPLIGHDP